MSLITSNLQIHYDFSDTNCYPGTGTTVTNLGLLGSSHDGYINADSIRTGTPAGTPPTFSTDNGGIFNFGSSKGRITIPHSSVTRLTTNTAADVKTIQMWVKFNSLQNNLGGVNNQIFGKISSNSGFDGYVGYVTSTGQLGMTFNDAIESKPLSATNEFVPNQWYFITWAFSGERLVNAFQFYKDNTNLTISPNQYSLSQTWSVNESNPLQIGAGVLNYGSTTIGSGLIAPGDMEILNGSVGAFYFYNSRLTAQDVIDNYEATKARFTASTNNLKYWDGTQWSIPTNKYQWDGINWVTLNGKYWNGTSWVDLI